MNPRPWIPAFGEDDEVGGEDDEVGGEDDEVGGEDDDVGGEDDDDVVPVVGGMTTFFSIPSRIA